MYAGRVKGRGTCSPPHTYTRGQKEGTTRFVEKDASDIRERLPFRGETGKTRTCD